MHTHLGTHLHIYLSNLTPIRCNIFCYIARSISREYERTGLAYPSLKGFVHVELRVARINKREK